MTSPGHLRLYSYNSTGFSCQRQEFVSRKLLPSCDILCLQETWHIPGGESKFNRFPGFQFFAVSGVEISRGPLIGRPYGGVVILYRKTIANLVQHIPTGSSRLCAIKLQSNGASCVLINCYLPCDDNSGQPVESSDLAEVLAGIERVMLDSDGSQIILCGDF